MSKKAIEVVPANQTILIQKAAEFLKYLAKYENFLGKPYSPGDDVDFDRIVYYLENADGVCTGITLIKTMCTLISRNQQDSKDKSLQIHNNLWFGEVRQLFAKWTPETHHSYNEDHKNSMLLFIQLFISAQGSKKVFGNSLFLDAKPSEWVVSKDRPITFKQIGEVYGFYHQNDLIKILMEILKKDRFIILASPTHVGVVFINDDHKIEFFDSNHDHDQVTYPNIKAVVDYFSTEYPDVRSDVLLPIVLSTYTSSPEDHSFPSVAEITKLSPSGKLAYSPEIPGYFDGITSLHIVARKNKNNKNYIRYWLNYLQDKTNRSTANSIIIAVFGDQEKFNQLDSDQRNKFLSVIDHHGQNVLIHALLAKQIEFAEIVLEEKINLNIQDKFGWTALMYAAQYPNDNIFATLLNKGADPFIRDLGGKSIIDILLKVKNRSAVQALKSLALPGGQNLLMQAVIKKDFDFVQLLKSRQINVQDELQKTALIYAVISGYQEGVDELLAVENIEVDLRDCSGGTALIYAAQKGHNEIFDKLLAKKCDPFIKDIAGKSAIQYVFESRNATQALSLLSYRFPNGSNLLMEAIINNDLESIRSLISLATTAEINAQNHYGRTALFYAAAFGNKQVVELLLKANADPLIEDRHKKSALNYALDYEHTDLYYLLFDAEMIAGAKRPPVATSGNHFTVFSNPSSSTRIPMAAIDNDPAPLVIATLA